MMAAVKRYGVQVISLVQRVIGDPILQRREFLRPPSHVIRLRQAKQVRALHPTVSGIIVKTWGSSVFLLSKSAPQA